MTLFEKALVLHLVGDWLLQNEWIARGKVSLRHPAAWVHGAIHGVLLGLVLGWHGGVVLGAMHMLVDTRIPQRWWSRCFVQTLHGEHGTHVMVWSDQVIHVCTIAIWFVLAPHLFP